MENECVDKSAIEIDNIDVSNKNKRKLSIEESDDVNPAKRLITQPIPTYYDICDEIQLEILKNLDTDSIINFSQTCERFHSLCLDKKFWRTIDCTANNLTVHNVLLRLNRLNESTRTFRIKGNASKDVEAIKNRPLKDKHTLGQLICGIKERSPLLEKLYLEQLWFDFGYQRSFKIKEFPSELRSLTFRRLIYPNPKGYKRESKIFTGIDCYMINLTELRLEFCNFFETNDLTAFSKIPNLKILSLQGCPKMKNCVPYLSLSCRFGFLKLETFDLRDTLITDSELQCLNILQNLKEFLVQRPIDKLKRPKLDRRYFLNSTTALNPNYQKVVTDPRVTQETAGTVSVDGAGTSQNNVAGTTDSKVNGGLLYDSDSADSEDAFFVSGMHHNPRFDSDSDEEPARVEQRYIRIAVNNNGLLAAQEAADPADPNGEGENNEEGEAIQFAPLGAVVRLFVGSPEFGNRFLRLNEMVLPPGEDEFPTGVSDRGMLGFGVPRPELIQDLVFLRAQRRDPQTYLERLTIRKYPRVTDITLSHLSTNAPNLVYIDITGCAKITDKAIENFKMMKPNCRVVAEDRNMF